MIVDQLFTPKLIKEGEVYDLGREYGAPPPEKKQKSQDPSDHNPYPFSPEEDDDYFREIFRKKREAAAKDQGVAEGEGNLGKALDTLSGNWSGWHQVKSRNPNIEKFEWDDGEGGFYAGGSIEHNLKTGEVTVDYHGEYDDEVKGTFKNMGDAMRALRGNGGSHGGQAPNFDRLRDRKPPGPDDLRKTDRTGRKGTIGGGYANQLKGSIQANKGRLGPKGVLPEQGVAEGTAQDSKSWMASIQQQYPDVKFVQAKMLGAPIMAMVNGKPVAQFDTKKGMSESKRNKQRKLNEAMLMEDPVYRSFKRVGRYISEQKLTEPEILQIFSDAETGMTDKGTGANRTWAGRGKDATVDFAKDVAGAVNGVLSSIQNSVPVAAVDVAYDQATDALANLAGGQKGAAMEAIKKYRNLVKQYPKTAGFAKAALVAIAGLATGGAGLPAIAGLTYALDSAIKGDKLSSVLGKGAGAAALAAAGQAIHGGATQTGPADTNAFTNVNNMGDHTGEYVSMPDGSDVVSPLVAPPPELAAYTVQQGDTLSQIAERFNTTVEELVGLNPQLAQASGATAGQGLNPDVIFPGQQITLPPATPGADVYAGAVGTNANTMADIAQGQVPNSAITQGMAARNAVRESIKYRARILPANRLIDQKATVLNWALSESVGRRSRSVNLTTIGTYTVFENIDRYRQALLERAETQPMTQPGRPELPDQYRPDMSGGAGVQSQPGLIGRGLNWLDKKAGQVGGALSNFGHQFTTNVTKEKLKMNWHQAGKPSDSDQLAAWLVKQGVPQEVVTSVFGKMGIPYTSPAAQATAQPTAQPAGQTAAPAKTGGAQKEMPQYGTNPATGKIWTYDELVAPETGLTPADIAPPAATKPDVAAAYNASLKAGKPASIAKPAVGPKTLGMRRTNVKKPTAPTATNVTSTYGPGFNKTNPTPDEQDAFAKSGFKAPALEARIASVLKKPVAEMLQMVETKEDVYRIKQFVDQTFSRYGAVNESAFAVRNQILEHVTQVGAQRRREHSQRVAH